MRNERHIPRSVNHETFSAIAREYPFEDPNHIIFEMTQAAKAKRKRERAEKRRQRADWFHEHVYRKVSKGLGAAVDKTRLPVTDIMLGTLLPYTVSRVPDIASDSTISPIVPDEIEEALHPWDFVPEAVEPYIDTPFATIVAAAVVTGASYFIMKDRTTPSEKLGVKAKDFDFREQVLGVIDQLNQREDVPRLSFDDVVPLASQAVGDFLEKCYGYRTESTNRVKQAAKPQWLYKLGRIHGSYNPTFGEIVLRDKTDIGAPAHELSHAKGVFKEAEAEFVGIAAQIDSDNPSLQYVGYTRWLDTLLSVTGLLTERKVEILHRLGLNHTTLHELQDEWTRRDEKAEKKLRRTKAVARTVYEATVPEKLRDRIHRARFHMHPRNVILRRSGQEDFLTAYTDRPLELLADYSRKREDH